MKKSLSLFAILIAISFMACSKDNDNSIESPFAGSWRLLYVNGAFEQPSYNFTPGVITWTLHPSTNLLNVVNNNTENNLVDIADTGTYNYRINNDPSSTSCGEVFSFGLYEQMGCIYIDENNHLIINQTYADGMRLEFIR